MSCVVYEEVAVADGEQEGGSLRVGSRVDDDYLTVTMLAAGLAGILRRRARAGSEGNRSEGLLPDAWRIAWDLERRIVASAQTERLLDLQKVYSLAGRPASADAYAYARVPRGPVDALLERYADQVLAIEPPPVSASADEISNWRARVREHVSSLIGEIRRHDDTRRKQIARQLAQLPEHERIWGRDKAPSQ